MCLSIVIAVALFMILPLFIADVIEKYVPGVTQSHVPVIEGIVKIIIFIGYLLLISLMKDIQRTLCTTEQSTSALIVLKPARYLQLKMLLQAQDFIRDVEQVFFSL